MPKRCKRKLKFTKEIEFNFGPKKLTKKEKERKRKKSEFQKKYRAKKKLEKEVHKIMEEVNNLNKEHKNKYNRFEIMDLDDE